MFPFSFDSRNTLRSFQLDFILKAEYYKICDIHRRTDAWAAEQFCSNVGEKKNCQKYRFSRTRLHYVHFRHFCYCRMKTIKDLSRGKIESVFRHFTKFNIRKTDSSQNSMSEKRTHHKIIRKMGSLPNSFAKKTRHFTKFNI